MNNSELAIYINQAISNILSEVLAHTFNNPKETAFLISYHTHSKKLTKLRMKWEAKGHHIPAFLISSITHTCNLFCAGCYARNNGMCCEEPTKTMLSAYEWESIFKQSSELGIGFHLLAGGEPLTRPDVIHMASSVHDVIFPIFTNGTLIDEEYCKLFDKSRNLIPVLSIEGSEKTTDSRRGEGIYFQLLDKMKLLKEHKILFGVSVTVTKENLSEAVNVDFIELLKSLGCRLIFYIEYVPIDSDTKEIAFSEKERMELEEYKINLKAKFPYILFLSFPGDEKSMGGCLAAGRGFFHINPYGEAEACPFSPYSDRSIENYTLLEILQSPFFKNLQQENLVGGEHSGGCALFEQESKVKSILESAK